MKSLTMPSNFSIPVGVEYPHLVDKGLCFLDHRLDLSCKRIQSTAGVSHVIHALILECVGRIGAIPRQPHCKLKGFWCCFDAGVEGHGCFWIICRTTCGGATQKFVEEHLC